MAIITTQTIELKNVPTKICIYGDYLDTGVGSIELEHAQRSDTGRFIDRICEGYDLSTEMNFVSSTGITGLQVLEFLAEWFESKQSS